MIVITGIIISRHFPIRIMVRQYIFKWNLSLCIDGITMLSYWVSNSSIFLISTRTSVLLLHHKEATQVYQRLCWCVHSYLHNSWSCGKSILLLMVVTSFIMLGYCLRLCTHSSLCAEFWVFAGCVFLKCACAITVSIARGLSKLCNN